MTLRDLGELTAFVLLVAGFIGNLWRTSHMRHNCIATLIEKVNELDRKVVAVFENQDNFRNELSEFKVIIAKIEQKVEDKFNGNTTS